MEHNRGLAKQPFAHARPCSHGEYYLFCTGLLRNTVGVDAWPRIQIPASAATPYAVQVLTAGASVSTSPYDSVLRVASTAPHETLTRESEASAAVPLFNLYNTRFACDGSNACGCVIGAVMEAEVAGWYTSASVPYLRRWYPLADVSTIVSQVDNVAVGHTQPTFCLARASAAPLCDCP